MTSDELRKAVSLLRKETPPNKEREVYSAPIHNGWIKAALADPNGLEADFLMYLSDKGMLCYDKQVDSTPAWEFSEWLPSSLTKK